MQITDFGFFRISDHGAQILCFENEDGQDWYDLRMALTSWDANGRFIDAIYGAWAMIDADGAVTNVEYDPSRLMPSDRRVLGIDAKHSDIKPGMIYRDGRLEAPE